MKLILNVKDKRHALLLKQINDSINRKRYRMLDGRKESSPYEMYNSTMLHITSSLEQLRKPFSARLEDLSAPAIINLSRNADKIMSEIKEKTKYADPKIWPLVAAIEDDIITPANEALDNIWSARYNLDRIKLMVKQGYTDLKKYAAAANIKK